MVTIRPAQLEDAMGLFELVSGFPTSTPADQAGFSACFRAKLSDPTSFLALTEKEGLLGGYISGYCHSAFYAGGSTAWVDEVFVISGLRGQGIGTLLMHGFEDWARQQSCVLVLLATAGSGPFYEHLGYSSKAGYYKKYFVQP